MIAEYAANVEYASIGAGDLKRATVRAQSERDGISIACVGSGERREGEVGEHVAVVDEEGFFSGEKVGDIGDAAAGVEEDGFVAESDREAPPVAEAVGIAKLPRRG